MTSPKRESCCHIRCNFAITPIEAQRFGPFRPHSFLLIEFPLFLPPLVSTLLWDSTVLALGMIMLAPASASAADRGSYCDATDATRCWSLDNSGLGQYTLILQNVSLTSSGYMCQSADVGLTMSIFPLLESGFATPCLLLNTICYTALM